MSKTWKEAERQVARRIGGKRTANHALGLRTPDCENDWLSVEVKTRKALPSWLTGAVTQAATNATPGKLPTVRLHRVGDRYGNDMIVLRATDFEEWFGQLVFGEEAQ